MKKKTHKLTVNTEHESILIGISSHENDYRISWAINQELEANFVKAENLKVINRKLNAPQEFSLYIYENEESINKFCLIANQCDNGFYIPELKNIDYFLQIFGEVSEEYKNNLLKKIKTIDVITGAFIIDPDSLKSKKKLIY